MQPTTELRRNVRRQFGMRALIALVSVPALLFFLWLDPPGFALAVVVGLLLTGVAVGAVVANLDVILEAALGRSLPRVADLSLRWQAAFVLGTTGNVLGFLLASIAIGVALGALTAVGHAGLFAAVGFNSGVALTSLGRALGWPERATAA